MRWYPVGSLRFFRRSAAGMLLAVAACRIPYAVPSSEVGSLQVTITDDQSHGVPGVGMTLTRAGHPPVSGMSGSDGNYVFTQLAVGNWTLAIELTPDIGLVGEVTRSVVVGASATASQLFRVVATGRGGIVGQVLHQGAGVAAVEMTARGPGDRLERTTTQDNGRFRFERLEAGQWQVDVAPPPYFRVPVGEPASRPVVVPASDSVTVSIGVVRPGGATTQNVALLWDAYDPDQFTIPAGTRIRWTNTFDKAHTISPGGHWAWRVVEMNKAGETFEAVLNNPGIYTYLCEYLYSNGMIGVITVVP